MLVEIVNLARDYPWGSTTLISDHFGLPATGKPMAEIWFGTHPGSPAMVLDSGVPLADLLGGQLGFLLKILAAAQPLSIQVHPNREQAQRGYHREQTAEPPIPAELRNYRDASDKPEMLVALEDGFEALCGFRPLAEQVDILGFAAEQSDAGWAERFAAWRDRLAAAAGSQSIAPEASRALEEVLGDLLSLPDAELTTLDFAALRARAESSSADHAVRDALEVAASLQRRYPSDVGVLVALLLNHVVLQRHQALSLPAGNLHAYLSGLGVEVMANSDNVLRAGLTQKHIDRQELLGLVAYQPLPEPVVSPRLLAQGLWQYPSPSENFDLYRLEPSSTVVLAELAIQGTGVVLVTAGAVEITSSKGERLRLTSGRAALLKDSSHFSFAGAGTAFLATGALA